jgi:hypothetical protein
MHVYGCYVTGGAATMAACALSDVHSCGSQSDVLVQLTPSSVEAVVVHCHLVQFWVGVSPVCSACCRGRLLLC